MGTLKDLAENIVKYLTRYCQRRFTGRIIFSVNIRDGGIGNIDVEIKHKLTKGDD